MDAVARTKYTVIFFFFVFLDVYEHTLYYQCGESVLYDNTGRKNK